MSNISLPNQWEARVYQRQLFQYLLTGGLDRKRAVCVWHRRAGRLMVDPKLVIDKI